MDALDSASINTLRQVVKARRAKLTLVLDPAELPALELAEYQELSRTMVESARRDHLPQVDAGVMVSGHTVIVTNDRGLMVVRDHGLESRPYSIYVTQPELNTWEGIRPDSTDGAMTGYEYDLFTAASHGDSTVGDLISTVITANPGLDRKLIRVRVQGALYGALAGKVHYWPCHFNGQEFIYLDDYGQTIIS